MPAFFFGPGSGPGCGWGFCGWLTTGTVSNVAVSQTTLPGQTATFTFFLFAPSTPGPYTHAWGLERFGAGQTGPFGEAIRIGATVN